MKKYESDFKMPRYAEIPDVGLYLEQVVKYVNDKLAIFNSPITTSMISNYVKKEYIARPIKKQYYADQICYILFIAIAKQSMSMDNIMTLFELQINSSSLSKAYDLFCDELEEMLRFVFGEDDTEPQKPKTDTVAKKTMYSVVLSISYSTYLNHYFLNLQENKDTDNN